MPKYLLTAGLLCTLTATLSAAPVQFLSPFAPTAPAARNNESVTSLPEGLVNEPDAIWRRDTLTGDWDGFRNQMNDAGIAITPVYEAEVFGSIGNGHGGAISDGLFSTSSALLISGPTLSST